MGLILKALGGIAALILIVITLLGSVVTLGGFLLAAIKILVIAIFLALLIGIIFTIIRDRSHRKREAQDF
jgi:L-asparagine transporter-like permease